MSTRVLLGTSLLLLTLSAVFGVLNTTKVKSLRAEQESALAARTQALNTRSSQPRQGQAGAGVDKAKLAETEARAANAEAEAAKARAEKADVAAKLQANQTELAQLQKKVEELSTASTQPAPPAEGPSVTELEAQLDETRQQLDNAEREKLFLTEKMKDASPHEELIQEQPSHRRPALQPGLHGTVLAVNQAYNFVVLDLGGRQGVETNAEMLVMRRGTIIGKIRVSSVEPATAIGDIISSTLPRGVQVQPGDTVIYAGTGS